MAHALDDSLSIDPVQSGLVRRQMRQILERPTEDRRAMSELAAACWMPWNRSLCFNTTLPKVGAAILVVLSRHWIPGRSGTTREVLYLRGFAASVDPHTSITCWEQAGACFAYDLNLPMQHRGFNQVLSSQNTALARLALDMDRELQRQAKVPFGVAETFRFPATLLAFPRGTRFQPEPTPAVLARARRERIGWREAWKALHQELRVPRSLASYEQELIDSRLCTRIRRGLNRPGSLGEYHCLEGLLDRPVFNPIRDGVLPRHLRRQQVLEAMKSRLPADLAEVCREEGLLAAAADPASPLIVRGLSRMQVWRLPHEAAEPEAFTVQQEGHAGDLWHVKPPWMGFFRSAVLRSPLHPPAAAVA